MSSSNESGTRVEYRCLTCGTERSVTSEYCPKCSNPPPWMNDVRNVENMIKERETSRVRAAVTLARELASAHRGGPPVSTGAVIGFVLSMMYQRMILVVGSILGVVLVLLQVALLYQQNAIVQTQASAALLERVQRTERIIGGVYGLFRDLASVLISADQLLSGPFEEPTCEGIRCNEALDAVPSVLRFQGALSGAATSGAVAFDPMSSDVIMLPITCGAGREFSMEFFSNLNALLAYAALHDSEQVQAASYILARESRHELSGVSQREAQDVLRDPSVQYMTARRLLKSVQRGVNELRAACGERLARDEDALGKMRDLLDAER